MDAAYAAAMSDPERNRFFSRRWTEPAEAQSQPTAERGQQDLLELTGRELLLLWRKEKAREEGRPR